MNSETITGGQLVNAAFLKPGAKKFAVSGITINGYQEDTGFYENTDFSCSFNLLDNAGRTLTGKDNVFSYDDIFDWDSNSFLGGSWSNNGTQIVPGDENDFELEAGQAVWIQIPANDGEHVFTFGTAGEVIQAEVPFPLVTGGNGVGNPMAVGVWVSDLVISGYQEDAGFYENTDFSCSFNLLDNAGRTLTGKDNVFTYDDTFDWDSDSFLGGVWSNNGSAITPHDEGDIQLNPGQGVWLQCPANDGEHTFVLTFPQVVGEQAVK